MPEDRYTHVTQALDLYRTIRRRSLTLDELSTEMGVSVATVRRLIEALVAGGAEIDAKRRKREGAGQPPYEYRAQRLH